MTTKVEKIMANPKVQDTITGISQYGKNHPMKLLGMVLGAALLIKAIKR